MMPVPPDSHKISLKIIEAIKQHPVLYSTEVRGPSVKLQDFRQKVWKRISDELGLDRTSFTSSCLHLFCYGCSVIYFFQISQGPLKAFVQLLQYNIN